MLSKEKFVKFVTAYINFDNYLDKLADLSINIWEDDDVGWFRDNYVHMVSELMGCEEHKDYFNEVEEYLYENCHDETPEEFYDKFMSPKNKFYSVEDDKVTPSTIYVDVSDLKDLINRLVGEK